MEKKYRELTSNSFLFFFSYICTKGIMFILVPLYTTYLSTTELGTAELVVSTTNLLLPVLTLGISNAVFRFAMQDNVERKQVLSCYAFILILSIPLTFLASRFSYIVPGLKNYSSYLFFLVVLTGIYDSITLFVKASGETKLFAVIGILYVGFLLATTVLFVIVLKYQSYGYTLSIITARIITIIIVSLTSKSIVKPKLRSVNFSLLREMVKYSFPLVFNSAFWWIVSSSDKYMISYMLNVSDVGIYSIAAKIPSLLSTFVSVFSEALVISAIKSYENKDSAFFSNVFKYFSSFIILITSFILVAIKDFMHIYVRNPEYNNSLYYLPCLLLGAFFLGYGYFFGVTFSASKDSKYIALSSFFAAVVNIILNLALIPSIGVLGASIATMISYIVLALFRAINSNRIVHIKIPIKKLILSFFLLGIQAVSITFDFHTRIFTSTCFLILILLYLDVLKYALTKFKTILKEKRR